MAGPRLLLADDDTRTARRLARMLEEDGWQVELCADGATAMARLSQTPPLDAIVADFGLADHGGVALHAEARRLTPPVPVIFVTNYPEHLKRMQLDPAPVVMGKPVDYAAFTVELARALGREAV